MLTFLCLLSCSSRLNTYFDERGHHRHVNQILGILLRLHYPGLVTKGGRSEPTITSHDYACAPDARYGNAHKFYHLQYIIYVLTVDCLIL
jgi:hypothetical protein